jgi:Zn-dependent metalloprotease
MKGEGVPSGAPSSATARERAQTFVNANAAAFGLRQTGTTTRRQAGVAVKQETPRDEVGVEHVRFQQLHNGIPVTGGELLVHLKGDRVVSAQAEVLLDAEVESTPKMSADEALKRAQDLMQKVDATARRPVYSTPRLEVFNRGILQDGTYPTRLTWFIEAATERVREFIWVDAITGGILLSFNQRPTAVNRQIHTADRSNTLPGRLIRSEGGAPTGDPDADRAYLFAGDTYNYFLTQHGRDSYDGAGAALISTTHYCERGCPMENAFWNGRQMVYGDGYSGADDVVGHELTHAVVEYSANLFYYMQSGALNESYADIFGETMDLLNGRGTDGAPVRWRLGEDLPIGAIRDMMNPWTFGNPGKVSDPQWHTDQNSDGGGVHINSGVPNHAYALMVDGGVYNGRTVTAIGLQAAGKIQYRALTKYLTSGANFLDNYKALQRACQDLIGTSGITAATCTQVKTAAEAVEMNGPIPFNPRIPALCPAGQTPRMLFSDNFEGAAGGKWSTRTLRGPGSWLLPITGWAKSGIHSAWGEDFETFNDAALEMAKSFTLPARARLQFNHAYAFEVDWFSAYDGGVIEVSEDGGSSWKDAGGLIRAGDRYDPNAPIDSSTGNSLAGRLAFVGSSYGYTASQLDLTSLAGKSVRFRFRVGTDELVGNIGWVIDDVRLYTCAP